MSYLFGTTSYDDGDNKNVFDDNNINKVNKEKEEEDNNDND